LSILLPLDIVYIGCILALSVGNDSHRGKENNMAFTNKYPGKCGKCGGTVHAFKGLCAKVNGKYTAFHGSCGAGPEDHPRHPKAAPGEAGCPTCGDPEFHDGEECHVTYDRRMAHKSSVLRNYRGEVLSYRNARGLCEDAPACGCCS
jgi:hypothetical protein